MPALLQIITNDTIPFVYSGSLLTKNSYLLYNVSLDNYSIRISIWFEEDVNIILGACQREVATHVRYQRATIRFILLQRGCSLGLPCPLGNAPEGFCITGI